MGAPKTIIRLTLLTICIISTSSLYAQRQVGSDIDGEAAGDHSGRSVSLSSDGSTVAIGAYLNDGNGTKSGHVRVYKNVSGTWTQVGSDIDGEAAGDRSGYSISLSEDGSTVAIGARYNDGKGTEAGHVRVYSVCTSSSTDTITSCGPYTRDGVTYTTSITNMDRTMKLTRVNRFILTRVNRSKLTTL